MSEKKDVWVVMRFDGPAQEHTDFIAVKGVYDSEQAAQDAADRGRSVQPIGQ